MMDMAHRPAELVTKPDVLRVLGLGHQSLQPEVLLLQLFEPLGLVHPHPEAGALRGPR